MIIVKLKGGLGNQLFQYALGRRLAFDNNLPLKLDISPGFENSFYKCRYSLSYFNIIEDIISPKYLKIIKHIQTQSIMGKLISLTKPLIPFLALEEIVESSFSFDNNLLRPYKNIYLDGYWQSEKYFKNIENIIRREFLLKYHLAGKSLSIAEKIKKSNSVSIHFRIFHGISEFKKGGAIDNRGRELHGTIELDYYYKAIKYLSTMHNDLHFFMFSDDPEWVEDNFKISYPYTIISHNRGIRDHEDLHLMSLCKHQIISNSSFSWWAAWLNTNTEKIVIAPRQWLADEKMNNQTQDRIPENWIRV